VSLAELDGLLIGLEPDLRRRVHLTFSELVARWQDEFAGDQISATVELLPGAIRVSFGNVDRVLAPSEWTELVSPPILASVDEWGLDRRGTGNAWFEFRPK
jgi:hypothetical protein